ncbi:MAG TPA: PPOX class F420-dependent oxidoreductase [Anaerolineales bacterium]|nr:PPOX class F420-dependent oxidoreductase [Anaerolineales bacterium]HRF45979.1 PPOX class F420-dependent oxidoreductase [Anaerolineales bacterium]
MIIPHDFLDLFQRRSFAHLATVMADGTPQVTPVWIDFDGEYVLVNSHKGRLKDKNMEERPHVAVEISDPDNPYRYIAIRGHVVEITEEGAEEHIDRLSLRYLNRAYEGAGRGIRRIYKIACDRIETSAWTPPASTAE